MLRQRLARFMIGRYGPDQLNMALLITAVILTFLSSISILGFLGIVAYILLFFAIFRLLSKNIVKRRAENDRFLRFWSPFKQRMIGKYRRFKARKDSKFFKCPSCKNILRLPKGKGKIQITCPKCGERFIKKT